MQSQSEEILSTVGETLEYAKIYTEQQITYFQLEASKKIATTTSMLVTLAVVALLSFLVLLFLSISAGFFLGQLLNSYGLAFLLLTLAYAILAFLIYQFRRQVITNPIFAIIVKNMLD